MNHLTRQRIKFMIEHGGAYTNDEPATRGFVLRVTLLLIVVYALIDFLISR